MTDSCAASAIQSNFDARTALAYIARGLINESAGIQPNGLEIDMAIVQAFVRIYPNVVNPDRVNPFIRLLFEPGGHLRWNSDFSNPLDFSLTLLD